MENTTTPFSLVYDSFLAKVTDDMYMEMNEHDTFLILQDLLINSLSKFEFPRKPLDYEEFLIAEEEEYCGVESDNLPVKALIGSGGCFVYSLTSEEINILATYMIVEWLSQQLAAIDNLRMKYSGTDFKFTSQANHMQKILQLKKDYEREGFHLQRLYKRRTIKEGKVVSTFRNIMAAEGEEIL